MGNHRLYQSAPEFQLPETITIGNHGRFVWIAQEWLCLHGFSTAIDGHYGPKTEQSLREFQMHSQLQESGQLTEETYRALLMPVHRATKPIPAHGRSFSELIALHAAQHLRERPREIGGENRGPWVRLYMNGKEGIDHGVMQAWCAGFVSFVVRAASRDCMIQVPFTLSNSCTMLARNARRAGCLYAAESLRSSCTKIPVGSLFLVRKEKDAWRHAGVVMAEEVESIQTIEGNTNECGEREGYEVCIRRRDYRRKDFIIWSGVTRLVAA